MKKLKLNRETVIALDPAQIAEAQGGCGTHTCATQQITACVSCGSGSGDETCMNSL